MTAVNDAPVVLDIPDQNIMEAQTFAQINLDDYVTDVDNLPSEMSWTSTGAIELAVDITNRVATITMPNSSWIGSETITFRATDPGSLFGEDAATFTVSANSVPVLNPIGTKTVVEMQTLNFTVSATDADGTIPILSTSTPLPGTATFVDNGDGTGVFNWTTDATDAGAYSVTFFATDANYPSDVDLEDVLIVVGEAGNQRPVIAPINDTLILEGSTLVMNVSATDPDGGIPSLTVGTSLQNYTFADHGDGTGTLTYSPDYTDAGVDTVRFFATDNGVPQMTGTEVAVVTTVDLNQPPVIDSIGPFAVEVGDTLVFTVTASDPTDTSETALVFLTALDIPANATYVDNGDNTGTFRFWPNSTQVGVDTVTFLAIDHENSGLTSSRKVQITVVGVDEPPVLAPIGPRTVNEGETLVINVSATDVDGPMLNLLVKNAPTGADFIDNGDGTGVFTFTPGFTQAGLYSVTFEAFDGIVIDKEIVFIQVFEAGNQAPVFDSLPVGLSVTEGLALEDIVRASDPEGNPVTLSAIAPPTNFTFFDSGNGTASFTFSPAFNQAGTYDILVRASDGTIADTVTLTIEVIEAGPQDPVLAPVPDQEGKERTLIQFTVTATDADGDFPILTTSTLPGTATFRDFANGTGRFAWTPTNFDSGLYPIMFYAEDATRPGVFDSMLVNIHVIDSNLAPNIFFITVNDSTSEGGTIEFQLGLWDVDGTIPIAGARLEGTVDSLAPNMEVIPTGDSSATFYFHPDYTQGANPPARYYVQFYARDAVDPTLVSYTETRLVKVLNVNAPPVLVFTSGTGPFQVTEGDTLRFTVSATDVDNTPATVSAENLPTNATFAGQAGSKLFRFVPDFSQAGTYTVRFLAVDPSLASDTQDVQITVIDAANQPPTFTVSPPPAITATPGVALQTLVRATDPELQNLVMTATPIPSGASFVDSGNGTLVYTYNADAADLGNVFQVFFIATDPGGASDTVSTTYTVTVVMRGDADGSESYTMNDIVFLANYLYRAGPVPSPVESGDVDLSGDINIADLAYLVNFMYHAGPRPPQ